VSQEIREREEVYVGIRSRACETGRRSKRSMRSLTVLLWDTCWDNFLVLSFVSQLLWEISFVRFTTNCIVSLVRRICDSYRGMTRMAKAVLGFLLYEGARPPISFSSFLSAPPPTIEILTPWEIIVRVSSSSGLLWWLLPRSTTHPSLPFLSLGCLASPPRGFLILSSFKHAWADVSPPYPALRNASRLAICTVGNPISIVNTRSLVSGYRWSSCPGSPPLPYCTLSWVARSVRSSFEES